MLTTREQIIQAGLAVELTNDRQLLICSAGSDQTDRKILEVPQPIYVVRFNNGNILLERSGVFVERTPSRYSRSQMPPGPKKPDVPFRSVPLFHVIWDGDTRSSRHPCDSLGLKLAMDTGKLMVWSLEGIPWVENRPPKQRRANNLAPLR